MLIRSIGLALLAIVGGATAGSSSVEVAPPFVLPTPTGRYPVGVTAWQLADATRAEIFAAPGMPRQVEVVAWYPAASGRGPRAPYLRWGLPEVQAFAQALGGARAAFDALANVRTHAAVDAPTAATPDRLPVLVFSHGYGSMPSAHAALLEELASHGYAVLSIVHPYESGAATLSDGTVVSLRDEGGTPRPAYQAVIGEWAREDEAMAEVTRASDPEEQRELLRAYLSRLPHTDAALRRWVDDTRLVLDRLSSLPAASSGARLAARLDSGRVGVFGHSMGGVTAGQFCVEDRRCAAGLNLDGIPQYGSMIERALDRPFLMVYSARPGRMGASDSIYRRAASEYYRVDVAGTRHLDFSDMIFWEGPLRDRGALGTISAAQATAITRAIVRQYFDHALRGRPSPLLNGTSRLPGVTVRKLPH